MERDLTAAARVQEAFLPPTTQHFAEMDVAWLFKPCAQLAGDTLNVVSLDEGHVGLYVLDVSGHGVAAALLAVTLSHLLSPRAEPGAILKRSIPGSTIYEMTNPAEVLRELSARFVFDGRREQYFTIVYGILEMETGEFRYATAGHPGPIHLAAGGAITMLDEPGFPIGFDKPAYRERLVRLEPGDRLYLYSDGVHEALSASQAAFGRERLKSQLEAARHRTLAESVEAVWQAVAKWSGEGSLRDDVSILGLEYEGAGYARPAAKRIGAKKAAR
jgi:sigma-B regulation protein RsbU (phosphoserine phosphatase)